LIEDLGTDAHGWYVSTPVKEHDRQYRVGTDGATLTVVNREYSTDIKLIPRVGGQDAVAMFAHPSGLIKYSVCITGDDIKVYRLDDSYTHTWVTLPTVDTSGAYDAIGGEHDGNTITIIARETQTHVLYEWWTQDEGDTWNGPTAMI